MDILASIGNFIIFQVLDQAPIFLGIITLVGLLLQKTPASEVFEGVIKTIVGMLILSPTPSPPLCSCLTMSLALAALCP